jgi:hypothetical protein
MFERKVQTAFCNKERFLVFNQGLPEESSEIRRVGPLRVTQHDSVVRRVWRRIWNSHVHLVVTINLHFAKSEA